MFTKAECPSPEIISCWCPFIRRKGLKTILASQVAQILTFFPNPHRSPQIAEPLAARAPSLPNPVALWPTLSPMPWALQAYVFLAKCVGDGGARRPGKCTYDLGPE